MQNIAICDIDGSYTNNLDLPKLEDELHHLRTLNLLKNYKVTKFDSAFSDQYQAELDANHKTFVKEVRDYFKGILSPYIDDIGDFIREVKPPKEPTFNNYFKKSSYIANFTGTECEQFAKVLCQSAAFSYFCDNHLSEDLSNYTLYQNIQKDGIKYEAKDSANKEKYKAKLREVD